MVEKIIAKFEKIEIWLWGQEEKRYSFSMKLFKKSLLWLRESPYY